VGYRCRRGELTSAACAPPSHGMFELGACGAVRRGARALVVGARPLGSEESPRENARQLGDHLGRIEPD